MICNVAVTHIHFHPNQEVLRQDELVNRMVFMLKGSLEYQHSIWGAPPVLLHAGQWACEETLWSIQSHLDGPMVATISGCEVLFVLAEEFRNVGRLYRDSVDTLGHYARVFVDRFNT